MVMGCNISEMEYKEDGNRCFHKRRYADAAQFYGKAISVNPKIATYYTNRALCYIKLKSWEKALQDCKTALELDNKLVKGYFFLGQALVEVKLFDDAINALLTAQALSRDQKLNYGDDIIACIRLAKKRKFNIEENIRIEQEISLLSYLTGLIQKDKQNQLVEIKSTSLSVCEKDEHILKTKLEASQKMEEVNELFSAVDDRRKKRELPDFLCGKISFELMRDPVITPTGITYERKNIVEHLQRVGHFDPVSRADLTQNQLIPNLAMKEVCDAFLEENPWAEDY